MNALLEWGFITFNSFFNNKSFYLCSNDSVLDSIYTSILVGFVSNNLLILQKLQKINAAARAVEPSAVHRRRRGSLERAQNKKWIEILEINGVYSPLKMSSTIFL